MSITREHKRYIKKHSRSKKIAEIAKELGLSEIMVRDYLKSKLPSDRFEKIVSEPDSHHSSFAFPSVSPLKWFRSHIGYFIFLAVIVFIAYANSLGGDFVSDDVGIIKNNPEITTLKFATTRSILFVRPIIYYIIVNTFGITPLPFHIVNILFHIGNVWLIFMLLFAFSSLPIAFVAAAIFAVHPAIAEAVTWISGGVYAQYSFFILASFLSFLYSFKNKKYYYLSMGLAVLSTLSGDRSILPFILTLFLLLFTEIKKTWKKVLPFFGISGLYMLNYISLITTRIADVKHEQFAEKISSNPILQIPTAISTYFEIYIWPDKLTFYYSDFVMTSFVYGSRVVVFLLFLGILYITFRWFRPLFFWLAVFVLALAPTLTPFGLSSIVNERYGYLSSIGFFFLVSYVVVNLFNKKKYETGFYIGLMIIVTALCIRTIVRNLDFRNEDYLWIATGKTAIYSPVAHMNLGDMHRRHRNYPEAEREFVNALQLNPNNAYAYYNLGLTYTEAQVYNGAIMAYNRALEIDKGIWQADQNIAVVYSELGNMDKAIFHIKEAIAKAPNQKALYVNAGVMSLKAGKKTESIYYLKKALEFDPNNERVRQVLFEAEKLK